MASGAFHWYELMTPDTAAAADFYGEVVGWEVENLGPYTLFKTARGGVAGLTTQPAEVAATGLGPGWMGYVAVPNVDEAARAVDEAGGTILIPPADIPGMLRLSTVSDPQGTVYVVYTGFNSEGPPTGGPDEPGYFGWRELMARDGAAAFDYYAGQYGWTRGEAIDMGPGGVYQLFDVGGAQNGGMMTKPAEMPLPAWNFYIQVDATGACIERVKANGGQLLMGPQEVPGGLWVAQCLDPQGAVCCFISPNP